ncbi:MAG: hypothetical protein IT537_26350 [Hyphomicrobiales bacterium]|nr:hypothetical protein [Hyphomicrobiales bacterium]
MPKAKNKLTPKEQRERFEKAVRDMIDAGELSLTEADEALDKLVRNAKDE